MYQLEKRRNDAARVMIAELNANDERAQVSHGGRRSETDNENNFMCRKVNKNRARDR